MLRQTQQEALQRQLDMLRARVARDYARQLAWRRRNPEKIAEYARRYRANRKK